MNPSTTQARVVVDEWVRAGVDDVVVCPGSRNAPFLLAVHAAAAAGRVRLHVRVDERSAGFLAVGLAGRTGRVVPVVVTSGTAVAELHPAVLEAAHSGAPLLVVSADRPLDLVGTGANQTVDQVGLYGRAVRAQVVLPLAEDTATHPEGPRRWRAAVARALDAARGGTGDDPGPVQLDVPLREPLVPDDPDVTDGTDDPDVASDLPAVARGRADGAPWTRVAARRSGPDPLALDPGAPTLVVAGHGAGAVPAGFGDEVPVVAEPDSPWWGRGNAAGPWLVDGLVDGPADDLTHDLLPAQVVVLGRPTLHRGVSRLLADPRVTVHVVPAVPALRLPAPETGTATRPGWTDVPGTVVAVGGPPRTWPDDAGARAFRAAWDAAGARAAAAVGDAIAAERWATGPALAAAVVAALPRGAVLVAGASNPIRDVALAAAPRHDVAVLSARGVSGIDGAVSFATGVALGGAGRQGGPVYALLGDVTFVHDAGGLLAGPEEPRPELVVVVADDDGGSIFAGLEPGATEHAAAFERVFATPHGTDLGALCRAHGVPFTDPVDRAGLVAALAPTGRPGVRVVRVAVDRADRRALGVRLAAAARAGTARRG